MRLLCDPDPDTSCGRMARWWITVAVGEVPVCDLHAEFYLRRGPRVYPRRGVAGVLIPCQRDEECWLTDGHAGHHEHVDADGRRVIA